MENRIYNFNPGPAMQPLEVLQEAQAEFLNFAKSHGISLFLTKTSILLLAIFIYYGFKYFNKLNYSFK